MIHNVDVHKAENVPLVGINLLTDDAYLLKGEVMDFIEVHRKVTLQDTDITEAQ